MIDKKRGMLIVFLLSLYILIPMLISVLKKESDTKIRCCPICSHRFEYSDTQAKVVCENCNYIMIFSVGEDIE